MDELTRRCKILSCRSAVSLVHLAVQKFEVSREKRSRLGLSILYACGGKRNLLCCSVIQQMSCFAEAAQVEHQTDLKEDRPLATSGIAQTEKVIPVTRACSGL